MLSRIFRGTWLTEQKGFILWQQTEKENKQHENEQHENTSKIASSSRVRKCL